MLRIQGWAVSYGMNSRAGKLPETDLTQLRHHLRTHGDEVWQCLHVSHHLAVSKADISQRASLYMCVAQMYATCQGLFEVANIYMAMWKLLL